jgi:undecaprenyl-diphosphatase
LDETLFRVFNDAFSGPYIGWLMVKITTPETWIAPAIALCIGMILVDRRRGLVAIVLAVIVVGFGDAMTHQAIKPLFGRIRPCNALEGVNLLVGCSNSLSFPSNHAVNSLAVAGVIGGIFRPMLFALVPIGLLVCLTRIAVGVHYPMDVAVGGLLGFGLGWGSSLFVKDWTTDPKDVIDER